eukprot:jgi/Astpho2/9468/gw1.00145.146.1_t
MHPPLYREKHPTCLQQIEDLETCHQEHPIAKFWGICNDQKYALDRCFRQEKALNSALNRKKSKNFQERLERIRQQQ